MSNTDNKCASYLYKVTKNHFTNIKNEPKYQLPLLPSLIITCGGIYLIIKMKDMNFSSLLSSDLFKNDIFKPIIDLYRIAKF